MGCRISTKTPAKNIKISEKSKGLYEDIKKTTGKNKGGRPSKYNEELHCGLVIEVFSKGGSLAEFCVKAGVGDSTFYNWVNSKPVFHECWRVGHMMGEHRWEKEGKDNHSDPDWNMDYWKIIGARLYQVGKNNKVRLNIIESDNPYNQYKQLVKQAQTGDFTASEIKQLSETINIGVRSYETFNLEAEVEEMKKQVEMMKKNNVTRIKPVVPTKKAN